LRERCAAVHPQQVHPQVRLKGHRAVEHVVETVDVEAVVAHHLQVAPQEAEAQALLQLPDK